MRKRVMSLVLAAVMLLGLAPAALADSGRSRRESFMSVAESQLGYREKFQNGTKYGSWYGLPGQPWCAMFVSWCARYSGVPESVIPNFSGCFGGVKWFKERGLWRTKEYTPQAGDLLFIDALEDNGKRDGLAEHVAIVERASDTTIYTIEGNSINDMVERRERPRDDSVLGYATPQYGTIGSPSGTISVSGAVVPSGTLGGEDFSISGTVRSGSTITWLYADIRNLDGDYFSCVQTSPKSKTADLYALNGKLSFSALGPGSYELFIEAVDENYNYMQKCYPFKVSATDICPDGRHADYAEGIQWVIDEGISNGTSAAKFLPDEQCTRAQVVTFIWRAAGRPAPKNGTCTFYDVSDGSYCAKAVQWAVEQGITKGVSAGYFDPYGKVTRAQFVTLLWRYLGQTEPGIENPFADIYAGTFCYRSVLWAYENGVTTGTGEYTFSPNSVIAAPRSQRSFTEHWIRPRSPLILLNRSSRSIRNPRSRSSRRSLLPKLHKIKTPCVIARCFLSVYASSGSASLRKSREMHQSAARPTSVYITRLTVAVCPPQIHATISNLNRPMLPQLMPPIMVRISAMRSIITCKHSFPTQYSR